MWAIVKGYVRVCVNNCDISYYCCMFVLGCFFFCGSVKGYLYTSAAIHKQVQSIWIDTYNSMTKYQASLIYKYYLILALWYDNTIQFILIHIIASIHKKSIHISIQQIIYSLYLYLVSVPITPLHRSTPTPPTHNPYPYSEWIHCPGTTITTTTVEWQHPIMYLEIAFGVRLYMHENMYACIHIYIYDMRNIILACIYYYYDGRCINVLIFHEWGWLSFSLINLQV